MRKGRPRGLPFLFENWVRTENRGQKEENKRTEIGRKMKGDAGSGEEVGEEEAGRGDGAAAASGAAERRDQWIAAGDPAVTGDPSGGDCAKDGRAAERGVGAREE